MKALILMLVIFVPFLAFAQEKEIPKDVIEQLSKDLLELHKQVLRIQKIYRESQLAQTPWPMFGGPMARAFDKVIVTKDDAPILIGADSSAGVLYKAGIGTSFPVVDKTEGWYAVGFDKPMHGYTSGWVKTGQAVPVWTPPSQRQDDSLAQHTYRYLVELASKFRAIYLNNEYISVTGFSIEIGLSTAPLSVDFEFK